MCLLIVASRIIPGAPLLIGANRDELLSRPSVTMTMLRSSGPRILGGRDEELGGTWLAVNEHGVFAGLTNQPLGEAKDLTRRSRGELPLDLASHPDARSAVDLFLDSHQPSDYNGSWLLVGDRDSLFFIDFTGLVAADAVKLSPGLYVLENRPLDKPSLKADHVIDALGPLTELEAALAKLRVVLGDHQAAEGSRPNCVHTEEYGTRSSCMIAHGEDPTSHPSIWVADGPPCTTPFVTVSELWTMDAPVPQ